MRITFLPAIIAALTLSSCFNLDRKQEKEPEPEPEEIEITIGKEVGEAIDEGLSEGLSGLQEAIGELEKSLSETKSGERVEPVDFRELKDLLPERINGMKRISSEGERSGWGNFKVSTAEARYEDDDKRMEVTIVDLGGMAGFAKIGMAAWADAEIDKETEHGYERTTTIDGYKAFEKYDSRSEDGEVAIIIEDRFVVSIDGRNISERDLKSALRKLDLKKLERMD